MRVVQKKQKHFLRYFIFLLMGLIIICVIFILLPPTSPKLNYEKSLTQSKAKPVWPDYGSGAVGMVGSDKTLTQHGDQLSRPIASITKVITALVVLEKKPLDGKQDGPKIKLSETDQVIYDEQLSMGAAVKPVSVGSSITERQMLEVMLLSSAANYSKSLAVWAYGSMDAYLMAANNWLKDHDLLQTKVVDTSGLESGNVSSPSDLVKLGKLVLKNKALAVIVATKKAKISGTGEISNGNRLLGQYGVNGIKTGLTEDAGACLLFSSVLKFKDQKITIVGSLLGGEDSAQVASDVAKLIGSVKNGFHYVNLTHKGQEYGSYKMPWGQTAKLVSDQDLNTVVWSDTPISVKVKADKIKFVWYGEHKGTLEVSVGDDIIHQPLIVVN